MMDDKISPQMQYAQQLLGGGDFAQQGGTIFQWVETHWEMQPAQILETHAIHSLFKIAPSRTNEKLAESAVATAALFLPPLPVRKEKTLADPVLPCKNGYVFIGKNSLELKAPNKKEGLTFLLDCNFETTAKAPLFSSFLREALPDDLTRDFLQEYAGYTLLNDTRFELAAWLIGRGGSGKGTFGVVMQALHKKTVALSIDCLDRFALQSLPGASLVYVDESPTGKFHEQKLKSCISGDTITTDVKQRAAITFCPTAKWIINGNNLPPISDHTSGFWRRFLVFKFDVTPARPVPMLAEHIVDEELSGVLNWAIEGLQRLLARGHFPALPEEMQSFKDSVAQAADSVAEWVDESEVKISLSTRKKDDCYISYVQFCNRNGLKPVSSPNHFKRLENLLPGITKSRPRADGEQVPCYNLTWRRDNQI